MNFFVDEKTIRFEFSGPDGPKRASVSICGLKNNLKFLEKSISIICVYGTGKSNFTQNNYVGNFIKKFCVFLIYRGEAVPRSAAHWSEFIYAFMNFYMTSDSFRGAVRVKLDVWQYRIAPIFDLLRNELIIPYETVIPRVSVKSEAYNASLKKTLRNMKLDKRFSSQPINKLVVDVSFAKNDKAYLDDIMHQSRKSIEILKKVLTMHWNHFNSDHQKFNQMADEIKEDDFSQIVNFDGSIKTVAPDGFRHLCSPIKENFIQWSFAIVRHQLSQGKELSCISLKKLQSLPYFKSNAFGTHEYKDGLRSVSAMPKYARERLSSANLLYRFAGLLSSVEVSVVCCLLIIEHPTFNPMSIANAKVESKKGKSFFIYTDDSTKLIFSVDKPRARSRKSAVLSDLACSIILKVIELTAPIRNMLRERGDPNSEYLFLGIKMGGNLGRNTAKLTDNLTAEKGQALCRSYPELIKNGLLRGTLSFRAIRNTMGVLRWFETGSITEMSKTLGNSEQVALESYLPPEILHAWNTRIIRRHQNTLIILAAHGEPYLLAATDFASAKDLADFISQLLIENKFSENPMADEINFRLDNNSTKKSLSSGILNIRLCEKSLAYLYTYSDWATKIAEMSDDKLSKDLMELSIFIQHTCQTKEICKEIENIVDVKALKRIHEKALVLKQTLRHLSFLSCASETGAK